MAAREIVGLLRLEINFHGVLFVFLKLASEASDALDG